MSNENIENIKNKIRKLLALSNDNPNDAESYSAMQKAQELMAQYKLERLDISEEKKQECVKVVTTVSYSTRSSDHYLDDLASVIAENFCCINYINTRRGTSTHRICFMGLKDDVDIAQEVLHTANVAIVRGYNRVYKEVCKENDITYLPARYFNPLKNGYTAGYIKGLKKALDDQKEKNQEWGLVLVVPQEAKDYLGSIGKIDISSAAASVTSHRFYEEGYNDGKNFHLNKKIEGKEQERIEYDSI